MKETIQDFCYSQEFIIPKKIIKNSQEKSFINLINRNPKEFKRSKDRNKSPDTGKEIPNLLNIINT